MAYIPDVPVDRYEESEEPFAVTTRSVSYSHNDMHSDNGEYFSLTFHPELEYFVVCDD